LADRDDLTVTHLKPDQPDQPLKLRNLTVNRY